MDFADRLLAALNGFAAAGLPCPTHRVLATSLEMSEARIERLFKELADSNKIARSGTPVSHIVTILAGPHAGLATGDRRLFCDICGSRRTPKANGGSACLKPSCVEEIRRRNSERVVWLSSPTGENLPQGCFAAHNLTFRPRTVRLPRPDTRTYAGVSSGWMAGR